MVHDAWTALPNPQTQKRLTKTIQFTSVVRAARSSVKSHSVAFTCSATTIAGHARYRKGSSRIGSSECLSTVNVPPLSIRLPTHAIKSPLEIVRLSPPQTVLEMPGSSRAWPWCCSMSAVAPPLSRQVMSAIHHAVIRGSNASAMAWIAHQTSVATAKWVPAAEVSQQTIARSTMAGVVKYADAGGACAVEVAIAIHSSCARSGRLGLE